MMISVSGSYPVVDADERVLRILHRAGGELSLSELILETDLPFHTVDSVVKQLQVQGKVSLRSSKDSPDPVVSLPSSTARLSASLKAVLTGFFRKT